MSGALPETERERQLRRLAGRLLTWPDPEGPVTTDLIPVGYPDDLPAELVDRTELRFFGSLVRRRAGALVGAELVFEGPGEPEVVVANYEAVLVGLGWERIDQPRPMRGGFDAHGFGEMSALVDGRKTAVIFLHATNREDGARLSFACATTRNMPRRCLRTWARACRAKRRCFAAEAAPRSEAAA